MKPHPREDTGAWEQVVHGRAQLSSASAADLLTACDGVIGMTTMVLIEAHLLGLPVLSLQPGRTSNANPLVDVATTPVLSWSTFLTPGRLTMLCWEPGRRSPHGSVAC